MDKDAKIKITKNGPYLVSGELPLDKQIIKIGKDNEPEKWIQGKRIPTPKIYSLCRCGKSKSKPFCDGTHNKVAFNGTETANKKTFYRRKEMYLVKVLTANKKRIRIVRNHFNASCF